MKSIFNNIYIKFTLVLTMIVVGAGCSNVLEEQPRSTLAPQFFESVEGLNAGLVAAYAYNRRCFGGQGALFVNTFGTDIFAQGQQISDPALMVYTGLNASEGNVLAIWDNAYPAINTCNGLIELGENITGMTEEEKLALIAEAKFLRGHYYYLLLRNFGGVTLDLGSGPLKFNTTPTSNLTRASLAETYDAIISDLEDAVENLPAERPTERGRAWKATALHVLSKVYLRRAWSSAAQSGDFDKAYTNAMDLILHHEDYGVNLLDNYADIHMEGNEGNDEVLFTVEWNGDENYTDYITYGTNGAENFSNFFFRCFYHQNQPGMIRDVTNGRPWTRFRPTPWLLDVAFEDKINDSRYDATFQTAWICNEDDPETSNIPAWTQSDVDAGYCDASQLNQPKFGLGDTAVWHVPLHIAEAWENAGITDYEVGKRGFDVWLPSRSHYQNLKYPSMKKWDCVQRPIAGTEEDANITSTRPIIVWRFAETYLIAAEAALKGAATQGTYTADYLVNQVRERAGALPADASEIDIDYILDERARELCGEYMRFFDLTRTNKLIDRVSASRGDMSLDMPVGYNHLFNDGAPAPGQLAPNPEDYHVLRPIPQTHLDAVTGDYPQNPGNGYL